MHFPMASQVMKMWKKIYKTEISTVILQQIMVQLQLLLAPTTCSQTWLGEIDGIFLRVEMLGTVQLKLTDSG